MQSVVYLFRWFLICSIFGTVILDGYNLPMKSTEESVGLIKNTGCEQLISTEDGKFHSPNYPANYPQSTQCRYTILKFSPDVCRISLIFWTFQVGRNAFDPYCSEDYLEVQDEDRTFRLCGELPRGYTKVITFPVGSSELKLNFWSQFHQRRGFNIAVKQLRNTCQTQPRKTTTESPDPNFSLPLSTCTRAFNGRIERLVHNPIDGTVLDTCLYIIGRSEPRACLVQIEFTVFYVVASADCYLDFVMMPDGQRLCGTLGGIRKYIQFPSGTNELVIFSSGHFNRFDLQVTQLPGPCDGQTKENKTEHHKHCDKTIRTPRGVLTSPGYPGSFGPNFQCEYRIFREDPSVCSLELEFVSFNTGKHNPKGCLRGAYLELPGRHRLCRELDGKMLVRVSEFADPVVLTFVSDSRSSGLGFRIEMTQLPNTCPGSVAQKGSPSHPRCYVEVSTHWGHFYNPAPGVATCEFAVQRADPSVCTVRLQVSAKSRLSVPCAHNYITLPGMVKMCISQTERREVTFAPGSNWIHLNYSNWHNPEFTLLVEQLQNSCPTRSSWSKYS